MGGGGKRDREMASIKSHRELRVYQMAMDVLCAFLS
jgi:hypothetical protein